VKLEALISVDPTVTRCEMRAPGRERPWSIGGFGGDGGGWSVLSPTRAGSGAAVG